jgi:hypothetical protein
MDTDEDWQARAEAAERELAAAQEDKRTRLVRAEMKVEAVRAGMVDLDGLKLLDLNAITLDDAGEVQNAAGLMAQLKVDKPFLFANSSSSYAVPPPSTPPKARLATEMTHEEWQAARARLVRRR